MSKKVKIAFSLLIITIVLFATIKQSIRLYYSMGRVELPTHQSRHFSDSGIYSWMTVGELSEQFGVKEGEIFKLLRITPKTEDYKLTLLELNKKYNISHAEMTKGLQSIIDYSSQKGDQHE